MITIDGSFGEGGGQIMRSALSASLLTGQAFRIKRIRAGRKKPGLLRQHLTAVEACAAICRAAVSGGYLHSTELVFEPGEIAGGEYNFAIGSAGSTTLVLQTLVLPLIFANLPSIVTIQGGTHNSYAPSFDFILHSFVPLLREMGADISVRLERPGFYPAGGGRIVAEIQPVKKLRPLSLLERGSLTQREARFLIAELPGEIAVREAAVVKSRLNWSDEECNIIHLKNAMCPGNAIVAQLSYQHVTETFTAFGEKGVKAELVAETLSRDVRDYLSSEAPVGKHLADQMILPCVSAGKGEFVCTAITPHFETNLSLLKQFCEIETGIERRDGKILVTLQAAALR